MKTFLVFTLAETSFTTTSYSGIFLVWSVIMQIWSMKYYILKMSRNTNIVYIRRYLALTYIERFISTICCFFSYICSSVNCMNWVSKFNIFFLTCLETEARFIFEDFNIALYGKFISYSAILFFIFSYVLKSISRVKQTF